ncbi:MAG: hypothetical protein M0R80_29255 [Proteobacteria bacterium]|jgi:hypothetical protein|nr:hypothetical protein [Pseudomonadota bacterium]
MGTRRRISEEDLKGLPGLSRKARRDLVEEQPRTLREAVAIPGVSYATTRQLVVLRLVEDPEGIYARPRGLPADFASERDKPLTVEDLRGMPYVRRKARDTLMAIQPATVFEALFLRGVGWGIARLLWERGLLGDPDDCLGNGWEFFWRLVVDRGLLDVFRYR